MTGIRLVGVDPMNSSSQKDANDLSDSVSAEDWKS